MTDTHSTTTAGNDTAGNDGPGDGAGDGHPPSMIDAPVKDKITGGMLLAIAIGVAAVGAALFSSDMGRDPHAMLNLLAAAGVALVMTALGGQSTIATKTTIFAGSTAAMFAILYFLQPEAKASTQFARGQISNVKWDKYEPFLKFRNYVATHFDRNSSEFRFVVFADELDTAEAKLLLLPRAGNDFELPSILIPARCFKPYLGKRAVIDWEFDEDGFVVLDKRQNRAAVGGEAATLNDDICKNLKISSAGDWMPSLVTAAVAQELKAPNQPLEADIRTKALMELRSDFSDVRRTARDTLSTGTAQDIPAMMKTMEDNPGDYRTQLGVTVALAEMLRREKGMRDAIAAQLTPAQQQILVDLAGHPDRTMRAWATEFLFDLGDPATAWLMIEKAAQTSDSKARYNWLFAARDGWSRMPDDQKKRAEALLKDIGARTADLPQTSKLLKWYGL